MGDKYLSKVIDYERDIKGHNFIAIYSGVGSGKSRFIDSFYKDDPDIKPPRKTVLVITSRRAKVDEILADQKVKKKKSKSGKSKDIILDEKDVKAYIQGKVGRWGNLHQVRKETEADAEFKEKYKDSLRIIERGNQKYFVYQQSVVCTNAFIERYLQYVYDPWDVTTHLWELFDMIVVDEAHSLVLDASYQSAPYYVHELIKEYLRRCKQGEKDFHLLPKCEHLILMTGTPEHLEELEVCRKNPMHVIDKMQECKNVVPKNIYFMKREEVAKQLEEKLIAGEKSIYFAQSIEVLKEFYNNISIDDKSVISYSFSNKEKRNQLSGDEKKIMKATEKCIKKNKELPEKIRLLLSTERNKEGININNTDITNLYVEAKHLGDIVQMAGRVRSGVENMYVVLDGGREVEDAFLSYDADFTETKLVGSGNDKNAVNDYWKALCEQRGSDLFKNREATKRAYDEDNEKWAGRFIDYIHENYSYVRYDYFQNYFVYDENRWNALLDYGVANFDMNQAIENGTVAELFEKRFPDSVVHPCVIEFEKEDAKQHNASCTENIEKAKQYIADNLVIGQKYSDNERERFILELNKILAKTYERIDLIFRYLKVDYKLMHVTERNTVSKKPITDKDKKCLLFMKK